MKSDITIEVKIKTVGCEKSLRKLIKSTSSGGLFAEIEYIKYNDVLDILCVKKQKLLDLRFEASVNGNLEYKNAINQAILILEAEF